MKRHTLIENKKINSHTYLVTIGTDIGEFTGAVECREEDYKYESSYFGYELAEIKAEISYAKAKRKYYGIQSKALNEFWGNMTKTRTYSMDDFWVKKIALMIEDLNCKRKFWTDRIKYLQEAYHLKITTFDSFKSTLYKFKEKDK